MVDKKKKQEKVVIEGVGKDAEVVTNAKGGKQSKSPMAMHLIDPHFLEHLLFQIDDKYEPYREAIREITRFMILKDKEFLLQAMIFLTTSECDTLIRIAKVLQEGAEHYAPNNWRLIPQEEHINHALIHLLAAEMGDTQDNHIDHALCRLMMAYATQCSPNFSYTEYKEVNNGI